MLLSKSVPWDSVAYKLALVPRVSDATFTLTRRMNGTSRSVALVESTGGFAAHWNILPCEATIGRRCFSVFCMWNLLERELFDLGERLLAG